MTTLKKWFTFTPNKITTKMTTADRTFLQLCEEIDYYKERAKHFENLYNKERENHMAYINESLADAKKGVANALMFALNVTDDANGNLVISKENRKQLADQYREENP